MGHLLEEMGCCYCYYRWGNTKFTWDLAGDVMEGLKVIAVGFYFKKIYPKVEGISEQLTSL